MERAEVPERSWLAFADAALVVALPGFLMLAFWQGPWLGSLIGGIAVRTVFLIGRGQYDEDRRRMIAFATLAYVVVAAIGIVFTVSSSCGEPSGQWLPYTYAAMGAVFAVGTGLSLWRRFLWGIPLAVLLAFVAFATLWLSLPRVAGACH